MGAYHSVYVGPYIELKFKDGVSKKTVRSCPEGHKNQNGQFCSVCGSKIISQERDVEIKKGFLQFMNDNYENEELDKFEGAFFEVPIQKVDQEYQILIPESKHESWKNYGSESFDLAVPMHGIPDIMVMFFKAYGKLVNKLKDWSEKPTDVELKFGVISYWN